MRFSMTSTGTDLDPSALDEVASTIEHYRDKLETHFTKLEEKFKGELALMYDVTMHREDNPAHRISQQFFNRPGKSYHLPVGTRFEYNYLFSSTWVIDRSVLTFQPAAIAAQEALQEARDNGSWLDAMTTADLDALQTIPALLADNMRALNTSRQFFQDGQNSIEVLQQSCLNSEWTGPGKDAYFQSLGIQLGRFGTCVDNIKAVEDGNMAVAKATIDLCSAIAEIYKNNVDNWVTIAKDVLDAFSDPRDWITPAKKLADEIGKVVKSHANDFQQKLDELGELADAELLLNRASGLRMTEWPQPDSPNGMPGGAWD